MFARPLSAVLLGLCGLAVAPSAPAMGLGPVPESIPYGRPLDLSVPLRLDRGDATPPGCLQAEVLAGSQRIPPGYLHVSLQGDAPAPGQTHIRVRSEVPVQEPALTLRLSVGCVGSVSRQFVLFADPGAQVAEAATAASGAAVPGRAPGTHSAQRMPRRTIDSTMAGSLRPVASLAPATAPAPGPQPEAAHATVPAAMGLQVPAPGAPPTPPDVPAAVVPEAHERLAALEGELQALRVDAETQRAAALQMRSRLAEVGDPGGTQGLLMALVGVLSLSVLALGWRLHSLRRTPAAMASPAAGASELAGTLTGPDSGDDATGGAERRRWSEGSPPGDGVPALDPVLSQPDRPGSVDELIDLEQEAEFFTLLGDDAAAIELLEKHIRRRGVTSPLPYLKQMELHRQRGDREAFAGAASRFGRHFAADAPAWDIAAEEGRGLQDHPAAVAELQSIWSAPDRALDRLEAMLFPGPRGAHFDLAACKDLLTLYQVARELRRMPPTAEAEVDLHLPLAADDALAATLSPSIFDTLAMGAVTSPMPVGAPAAPDGSAGLDLDLSEPAPLDEPAGQAAAERSAA